MASRPTSDPTRTFRGSIDATRASLSGRGSGRPHPLLSMERPSHPDYEVHKRTLHQELLDSLDFEEVGNVPKEKLRVRLQNDLTERLERRTLPLNRLERDRMVQEILDNVLGLGPLEPLLADPAVSDILVNGPHQVYVDRGGKLTLTNTRFDDNRHLMQIIDRIVVAVGRRVDEQHPMVDARMADGSRINAIIPPLALDGPVLSIRRFSKKPLTAADLTDRGSVPHPLMLVLKGTVQVGLNTLISGGTGSGKTTLLNVLSGFIPEDERIITIEDSAELRLQQPHVVRLETRPPNLEGRGEVTQRDLVRNSLRMRPDRIILGEVRGTESIDMLTAMNTGHEGSLATIHANNTRDALARLETMVGMGMPNMRTQAIRETVVRAIDLLIQQTRFPDGSRRITSITEVVGLEGETLLTQDIFVFEQTGVDERGKVRGVFRATGVRPHFADRLATHGIHLSDRLFSFRMEV